MGDGTDAATGESGPSRRTVLAGAAGLGGVLATGGLAWRAADAVAAPAGAGIAPAAETTGGLINLTLNGTQVALLKSADIGGAVAEVEEGEQSGGIIKKHISNVKYEDISIKCGPGMGKDLRLWLVDTMLMKAPTRSGQINFAHDGIIQKVDFQNALITEIGFPALDGASKDPAYLTIKFAPAASRYSPKGGSAPTGSTSAKKWLQSNFKFEMEGLDTKRVSKIDAFTIKQSVVSTGKELIPGKLEFPNVKWEGPDFDTATNGWISWFDDFVIKGNNGQEQERSAKISFLDSTLTTVLMAVDLRSCGPVSLTPDAFNPKEIARRVTVEMYCESIGSKFG